MINQFGSVHRDDLVLVGEVYHRVALYNIDRDKVAAREMAMLHESIAGTKHTLLTKSEE